MCIEKKYKITKELMCCSYQLETQHNPLAENAAPAPPTQMRLTVSRVPEQLVFSRHLLSILRLAMRALLCLFFAAAILHLSAQTLSALQVENHISFIDAVVKEDIKIEQSGWYQTIKNNLSRIVLSLVVSFAA